MELFIKSIDSPSTKALAVVADRILDCTSAVTAECDISRVLIDDISSKIADLYVPGDLDLLVGIISGMALLKSLTYKDADIALILDQLCDSVVNKNSDVSSRTLHSVSECKNALNEYVGYSDSNFMDTILINLRKMIS